MQGPTDSKWLLSAAVEVSRLQPCMAPVMLLSAAV